MTDQQTNERIEGIRSYLGMWRELRDRTGAKGADGMIMTADYILENADVFAGRVLPSEYRMGEIKMCFKNAAELALADPSLTYHEGYAVGRAGIPVLHAWCVDEDGGVVDPTWPTDGADPTEWTYLGCGFQTDFVCRVLVEKETWGVLDSPLVYENDASDSCAD